MGTSTPNITIYNVYRNGGTVKLLDLGLAQVCSDYLALPHFGRNLAILPLIISAR